MASCTFFGHRECPSEIKPAIRKAIIDLIETREVDLFYAGNQGQFDALVRAVLCEVKSAYPDIRYAVVLAYMPQSSREDFSDTMLPEGIERIHKRFAISWRNKWMINHAEYVVAYVTHTWGSAAKFVQLADKKGKTILSLPGAYLP